MGRITFAIYGIVAYLIAMSSIVYAIGFIGDLWVPKTINEGAPVSYREALLVNLLLLLLFAIQHSGMARRGFKKCWAAIAPNIIERSTYVLVSGACLWLLYWQWRPMPDKIWSTDNATGSAMLNVIYFVGWGTAILSTFLINHAELFGLNQVAHAWLETNHEVAEFRMPALYKLIRHPIYLGFLLAFWATPVMTGGRLLFAIVATAYILIGIYLEERDLIEAFGDIYRNYRSRVPMLLPWPRSRRRSERPDSFRSIASTRDE